MIRSRMPIRFRNEGGLGLKPSHKIEVNDRHVTLNHKAHAFDLRVTRRR